MIDVIYIEDEIADHSRTLAMIARFPRATVVPCERYTEVFNPRSQNFRIQKQKPALILAKKHGNRVHPTPPGYGIGAERNFYFSHMLNCLYDCRYCFLQGMFSSANYVFFVNFEEFEESIDDAIADAKQVGETACFFSGYDCDSLAMEKLTGFADAFLPFFAKRPQALLELRTKSINVASLLNRPEALPNVVVAFSVSPPRVAESVEHGAPPVARRIDALAKLAERGWPIGLRIDPLIAAPDFEEGYRKLIASIFDRVSAESIHSVTVGPMRFPQAMLDRITRLYPEEPLFAASFEKRKDGLVSYPVEIEAGMRAFVIERLRERMPADRIFDCVEPAVAGV